MPRPLSRTGCCLVLSLLLFSGCERRWGGIIVKKRVYLDGFYVHVPGKRTTDVQACPKPEPYPVAYPHHAYSRTDNDTAIARNLPPRTSAPVAPPVVQQAPETIVPPVETDPGSAVAQATEPGAGPTPVPPADGPGTGFLLPPDTAGPPVVQVDPSPSDTVPSPDTTAVAQLPLPPSKSRNRPGMNFSLLAYAGFSEGTKPGQPAEPYSLAAGIGGRSTIDLRPQHAMVADAGFRFDQYYIDQRHAKPFPLSQAKHDHERITAVNVHLAIGYRFQPQREENSSVKWFDAGLYGDWAFHTVYAWKDIDRETTHADHSLATMKFTGLHYLRKLNYGATLRFGGEWWSVFATCRLNKMWKSAEAVPANDLPPLTVGMEIFFGE